MAVVANATAPETLPPATALAVVAKVARPTAPETLPPATLFADAATVALDARPVSAPVNVVAVTLPALILPDTDKLVNVPNDVTLG